MVAVAQLVRVPGCGPGGRRFEPGQPPQKKRLANASLFSMKRSLREHDVATLTMSLR